MVHAPFKVLLACRSESAFLGLRVEQLRETLFGFKDGFGSQLGLDRDAKSKGASPKWWWSVGVTVELGCSNSFTSLKPRFRKKNRLKSGLGLRGLRCETTIYGGDEDDRCCIGVSLVVCASVDICAVQVLKRCRVEAMHVLRLC